MVFVQLSIFLLTIKIFLKKLSKFMENIFFLNVLFTVLNFQESGSNDIFFAFFCATIRALEL